MGIDIQRDRKYLTLLLLSLQKAFLLASFIIVTGIFIDALMSERKTIDELIVIFGQGKVKEFKVCHICVPTPHNECKYHILQTLIKIQILKIMIFKL